MQPFYPYITALAQSICITAVIFLFFVMVFRKLKDWQIIELTGKGVLLFAIGYQLIILGSLANAKLTLEELRNEAFERQSEVQLDKIKHQLERHSIGTQKSIAMNRLMLTKIRPFPASSTDKADALLESVNQELDLLEKSEELTKEIVTRLDSELPKLEKTIEDTERISENGKALQNAMNLTFLFSFLIGSFLILVARILELRIENKEVKKESLDEKLRRLAQGVSFD